MLSSDGIALFVILFIVFVFLGFYGARFRRGDLRGLNEWGLGGQRMGPWLLWVLVGADLYTAYTFVAIPSGVYGAGALYFYAVPYVALTFAIAVVTMPRLWVVSRNRGYITAVDFVKDRFNSRNLALAVALTGVVAELPYIALQIVGMQSVLTVMLLGVANVKTVTEVALIVAFIILAIFTFTSGLRGAALGAIMKDVLIFGSVIAVVVVVLGNCGGFTTAFANAPASYADLPSISIPKFWSLFFGSALALYLYPHAINGCLSASDKKSLRLSQALLPIYGVGLAMLALFGILLYGIPAALSIVKTSANGALTVPAIIITVLPGWGAGIALLAVFIGGLVPAAIMAIAAANLLTRNVVKEIYPKITPHGETQAAKWISAAVKFVALAFVFTVSTTYAVQLQLLGGVLIAQTLPAVFLGLYTRWLDGKALTVGWAVGIISGIYLVLDTNKFGILISSLFNTPFGYLYIAILALGLNFLVAVVGTAVVRITRFHREGIIPEEDLRRVRTGSPSAAVSTPITPISAAPTGEAASD